MITVTGIAKATLAFVRAVQAKVDGGDPIAAVADDGLFDSPVEGFSLVTLSLTPGTHRIDIQMIDQAGNMAMKTITVKVPDLRMQRPTPFGVGLFLRLSASALMSLPSLRHRGPLSGFATFPPSEWEIGR